MPTLNTSVIESWHAHVYFDASSVETARDLRRAIEADLADRGPASDVELPAGVCAGELH